MKSDEAPNLTSKLEGFFEGNDSFDRYAFRSWITVLVWVGLMKVRREERALMARIRVDRDYGTD